MKKKINYKAPKKTTHWNAALDWASENYLELSRRYPNQWVAFGSRCVLAHGKNLVQVLNQASHKTRWRNIPHLFVESGIHVYAS